MTLGFKDFVKPGDSMDLVVDQGRLAIQRVVVNSYLDSEKDAINLEVGFATLPDGVNYAAQTTLSVSAKNIQVVIQNSDYKLMQAVQVAPSSAPAGYLYDQVKPRMAMGTHASYDDYVIPEIIAEVREHWKGPFHLGAPDMIVVNMTKDKVWVRDGVVPEYPNMAPP